MDVRQATPDDVESIRHVALESLTATYASFLGEETIETAVGQWYADEDVSDLLEDEDALVLVAVEDGEIVGFSQNDVVRATETLGEIRWLHVDPDHRGEGVGDHLLEATRAALADRDVDQLLGLVLAENEAGNEFYVGHEFELLDSRTLDIAEGTYEENVYVDAIGGTAELDWLETETVDGETFQVALEESERGSQAPFYAAYRDRERERRYGWYCSNCESVDVAMDSMGRIVCNQCGNTHKGTRWDDAYL